MTEDLQIDWSIFGGSVALVLALVIPLALYPEQGRVLLGEAFELLTHNLGILYIATGVGALAFLLYLAFGRFGGIVFSRGEDTGPQFSTISWSAMLFCGGIGTSVLYWGTVEWAHYFLTPPLSLQPQSDAALPWALAYPIFHWGFIGWAFYCLPGVAMGYAYYIKGASTLRLSLACESVIPPVARPVLNPLIDLIFVVGLVGACSTGIGLAVPLIGTLSTHLLGVSHQELGFGLDVLVIVIITLLFSASAWLGLDRGIKRLSNINIGLAFLLILVVLLLGPTLFILELGVGTLGHLLQNFIFMSTWTDPQGNGNFVESWTVFYWAWWLALGPFMGVFIAKISRGRTMRQMILGCLGYGTLGCTMFFVVLGNYAAFLELNGVVDVLHIMQSQSPPDAVVAVLATLPGSGFLIFVFAVVCVIFAATSYDSASYTIATAVTYQIGENQHPGRWHRVFWACFLGLLPITLIYMGGLRPLQSAVTLASVPLLVVFVLMSWVLWRDLHVRDQVPETSPITSK